MKKQVLFMTGIIIIIAALVNPAMAAQSEQIRPTSVEIKLADNLDDERDYCIDIAGSQTFTPGETNQLQAHTCYSYKGGLGRDQAMRTKGIDEHKIKMTEFDVCMVATEAAVGGELVLAPCENVPLQDFTLTPEGRIVLTQFPDLGVTVDGNNKKEGRGGIPIHVMRPVYLDKVDNSKDTYQSWVLRGELKP